MGYLQDRQKLQTNISKLWNRRPDAIGKWGETLHVIDFSHIRGASGTVKFAWPISVISGTNGTGKTTILQLCTMAYIDTSGKQCDFRPARWFAPPLSGNNPSTTKESRVCYTFASGKRVEILSRGEKLEERRGMPKRYMLFRGIAEDNPLIERRDVVRQHQKHIRVENKAPASAPERNWASKILGVSIQRADFLTIAGRRHVQFRERYLNVSKAGVSYFDREMGTGERKILRLVHELENLPKQSLVLLEEPETTLHPDLHRGLADYLMDLCLRQGHQIVITTHSPTLFRAVPPEARILLSRTEGTVSAKLRASPLEMEQKLSGSVLTNRDIILVEDCPAKIFLKTILEKYDWDLLERACIVTIGDCNKLRELVESLSAGGVRVVGVRDPDKGENPSGKLLSLPGENAIEPLLLEAENLGRVQIDGIQEKFQRARASCGRYEGTNYWKCVMEELGGHLRVKKEELLRDLTIAWIQEPEHEKAAKDLIARIREALGED